MTLRRGEVLGLTGLVGSGRTETARLIFGADRRDGGTVALDGRVLDVRTPRDAIRAGIALLTEDRKGQGLIAAHPVRDNFALPNLGRWSRLGVLDRTPAAPPARCVRVSPVRAEPRRFETTVTEVGQPGQ